MILKNPYPITVNSMITSVKITSVVVWKESYLHLNNDTILTATELKTPNYMFKNMFYLK